MAVCFVFIFDGCKDCDDPSDPDCKNYDPCHDVKPANADFGIYEYVKYVGPSKKIMIYGKEESDTVYGGNDIMFKPKHKYDKVTWFIGSEVLTVDSFIRTSFPANRHITVTMIAEVKPSNCLNQNQLRDTVTKTFYTVKHFTWSDSLTFLENPFWGTWEGFNI